jgi:hypothetical protein
MDFVRYRSIFTFKYIIYSILLLLSQSLQKHGNLRNPSCLWPYSTGRAPVYCGLKIHYCNNYETQHVACNLQTILRPQQRMQIPTYYFKTGGIEFYGYRNMALHSNSITIIVFAIIICFKQQHVFGDAKRPV